MIQIDIQKKLQGSNGLFTLQICEQIEAREFVGLYGNSGSGKTTLLRILSGLDNPDSGIITVNNVVWYDSENNINLSPQKRNLGFVFQQDVLFPNMTVIQNLEFALGKGQPKDLMLELIEVMELKAFLTMPIQKLSGGQKQRISLARTLVQQPKLLLLDEPLSALDFDMRKKLQYYIKKAHKNYGLTSIIVSHDPWELSKTSSIIWKLKNGQIIEKGNSKDVLPID